MSHQAAPLPQVCVTDLVLLLSILVKSMAFLKLIVHVLAQVHFLPRIMAPMVNGCVQKDMSLVPPLVDQDVQVG